jgi:hypothetical protein
MQSYDCCERSESLRGNVPKHERAKSPSEVDEQDGQRSADAPGNELNRGKEPNVLEPRKDCTRNPKWKRKGERGKEPGQGPLEGLPAERKREPAHQKDRDDERQLKEHESSHAAQQRRQLGAGTHWATSTRDVCNLSGQERHDAEVQKSREPKKLASNEPKAVVFLPEMKEVEPCEKETGKSRNNKIEIADPEPR